MPAVHYSRYFAYSVPRPGRRSVARAACYAPARSPPAHATGCYSLSGCGGRGMHAARLPAAPALPPYPPPQGSERIVGTNKAGGFIHDLMPSCHPLRLPALRRAAVLTPAVMCGQGCCNAQEWRTLSTATSWRRRSRQFCVASAAPYARHASLPRAVPWHPPCAGWLLCDTCLRRASAALHVVAPHSSALGLRFFARPSCVCLIGHLLKHYTLFGRAFHADLAQPCLPPALSNKSHRAALHVKRLAVSSFSEPVALRLSEKYPIWHTPACTCFLFDFEFDSTYPSTHERLRTQAGGCGGREIDAPLLVHTCGTHTTACGPTGGGFALQPVPGNDRRMIAFCFASDGFNQSLVSPTVWPRGAL